TPLPVLLDETDGVRSNPGVDVVGVLSHGASLSLCQMGDESVSCGDFSRLAPNGGVSQAHRPFPCAGLRTGLGIVGRVLPTWEPVRR
ncbi:hypothetical protein JXA88_15790, partial [Candidatus Fermentibacteria bacterium]|nr:hypothetical protein [Candidatus Fermentibacteria bacterium]